MKFKEPVGEVDELAEPPAACFADVTRQSLQHRRLLPAQVLPARLEIRHVALRDKASKGGGFRG